MWLTRLGYCIWERLLYSEFGTKNCQANQRRFSTWLLLGTICIWQFGICEAQKDTGAFAEGKKGGEDQLQGSRKGFENGQRVVNNVAGRPGNIRATVHTETGDSGGEPGGSVAQTPNQNANIAPPGNIARIPPEDRAGNAGAGGENIENLEEAGRGVNIGRGRQQQSQLPQGQDQDQPPVPRVRPVLTRPIQPGSGAPQGATGETGGEALAPNTTIAGGDAAAATLNQGGGLQSAGAGGRDNAKGPPGGNNGPAGAGSSGETVPLSPVITNNGPSDANHGAPKRAGGQIGIAGGAEGTESVNPSGPIGAGPGSGHPSGPLGGTSHGQGEGAPRKNPTNSPQLTPRSGSPDAFPRPHEPVGIVSPTSPAPQSPPPSGQGEETGEDGASSELIKAVNDEYVDVVKNLTDAGILTEADYESKPVSDLFALLLEKLINANPGANEEEQRLLVHQAGTEFVEVFKSNAAVTKNVTEIVRLVNEQLQQPTAVLNEGHAEGASNGSGPASPTNSFNPFDAGATQLRAGNSAGVNSQASGEKTVGNGSTASNNTSQATNQQAIGNASGHSRRPIGVQIPPEQPRLPGPPGSGEVQVEPSLESSTPTSGFGLFSSGDGNVPAPGAGEAESTPPPFGFHNGPTPPKFGSANGQNPFIQGNNATNSFENGTLIQGSTVEQVAVGSEAPELQAVVPPVNTRYPFPSRIPSTLRPPLRFFTPSSTAPTISAGDLQPQHSGLPVTTPNPFALAGSSPGSVPFGRGPGSGPSDESLVIGAAPGINDSFSGAIGSGDFPTPPTWDFGSELSSAGPVGIGEGGLIGGSDDGEGARLVTLHPLEGSGSAEVFGSGEVSDSTPGFLIGSSPKPASINPFGEGFQSQSPQITTPFGDNLAPFTHDVNDPFGHALPTIEGELSNATTSNVETSSGHSNASGDEWLEFGSGFPSAATPEPFDENATSTSGEAFITESINGTEISSLAPFGFPGAESGAGPIGPIGSNGTNVIVPNEGLGVDPFSASTHSSAEVPFEIPEITTGGPNETGPVGVSDSGGLIIGHEGDRNLAVSGIAEPTSSGSLFTTESVISLSGGPDVNETVPEVDAGIPPNAPPGGIDVSSTVGIESRPSSAGSGEHSTTGEHGLAGEVTIQTVQSAEITSRAPGIAELVTTSAGGLVTTSGSSSNPVLVWSFRMPDAPWDPELLNKESEPFQHLNSDIILDLQTLFKTLEPKRFLDVSIKRFSKGSVVVDGQTTWNERPDSQLLLENFVRLVGERKNMIGGRNVDPASITFDRSQNAPQSGSTNSVVSAGGTPNWVIALVVAAVLLVLIVIAAVVVIKRRKRQANRDNYMVDEETMNGGAKAWPPNHARARQHPQAPVQHSSRGTGLSNGRDDQFPGVNMYEMKEPSAPNAHLNYGYQPDRAANGVGAHGRSVTEIHINAETNVDNEASSKH